MKSYRIWLMGMLAVLAITSIGAAQSPPAAAPTAPKVVTPAATDTAPPPIREESIYIPYSKLREVFEKEGRGVFLPYDRFMTLWRAAQDKNPATAEVKPPVDWLVTELDAKATVSKDVVTVTATLKIEVLKEGWNEVLLRLGDVALTKATLDGEPARILFDASAGGHKFLVEKKGKAPQQFALALTFAKAYTKAPGQNSVSFEAPAAPVSRWEVHIPESGVKVNVHPLLAATEVPSAPKPAVTGTAPAAEETVVLAFVGAAPTVRLDWTPKAEGAKGLDALASVRVQQRTDVEEGVTRTKANLTYEISRAELGRLEIEVPADQKVVNVFDPNVREWSVTVAGEVQKIAVQLFEPAKATQALTVELEKFSADTALDVRVPAIKALGVGRQQGFVVVHVAEGLRAEAGERSGLAQVDESELPGTLRSKWEFAYRYAALPFTLALKVEKVQPRITADSLVEAHLGTDKLAMSLTAVYTIERAGVFRLEVDIPEGFDVRSVRGATVQGVAAAQVDSHHVEGDKKTHIVVSLSRKAIGRVSLEVLLERALHEPDLLTPTGKTVALGLVIPRVAPGTVERETGSLIVYAPESLIVNPTKSDGLRSITFAEAASLVSGQRSAASATERAVLSFAYTQEPVTMALSAERRKPYVTARQLLVARIDAGVVKYESTIFYDVAYSGVKTLRLDVPKDLAGDLRITTPGLRHQPVEDQAALKDLAAGYEAWSLAGETEFMGRVEVRLAWERNEKFDVGKKVTLTVPRLIPRSTDRAWGQIVLVKAETIDVQESAEPGKVAGLRGIDPQQDLMSGAAVPGAARAFEFHEDWALAVDATMYKLEDVKRTSIERGLVRMVVTQGDQMPVQALYRVRSARQRLLVRLPENTAFDTEPLRLNGRPVALESGGQDKNTFFVPLVGAPANAPFLLELRYTVKGAGLALECPSFPEEQPAVQQVYLSIYIPQEWDLLGANGPWSEEMVWRAAGFGYKPSPVRADSDLITWVRDGCAAEGNPEQNFPVDGKHLLYSSLRPAGPPEGTLRLSAFSSRWLSILSFGLVGVIGVALMFTKGSRRLLAIGVALVLAVLSGAFLPTFSRQIFDGITMSAVFIVLVLWAVWWLLVTRPRDPMVIARRETREARVKAARENALRAAQDAAARRATAAAKSAAPAAETPPSPAKPKNEGGEPHA
jgi:hypothetical protein